MSHTISTIVCEAPIKIVFLFKMNSRSDVPSNSQSVMYNQLQYFKTGEQHIIQIFNELENYIQINFPEGGHKMIFY